MKINKVIKEKRMELGMTQEQVANRLGVTTPAVNKWENGVSYPDITLLPSLARLLGTDLNTLLSFREDLSAEEVREFLNEITEVGMSKGIEAAFSNAEEKLREYPSSGLLTLNVALTLEGVLIFQPQTENPQIYLDKVEKLYERAAESQELPVQQHAKAMLISRYMGRKEYDRAEKLLEDLPKENMYDATALRINLNMAKEEWSEAALLAERKLLSEVSGVQSILYTMMEIAIKEKRMEDAKYISKVAKDLTEIFDLWEFGIHVADYQYATAAEDSVGCVAAMEKMLEALKKVWKTNTSPLYRHIPEKEEVLNFGELMAQRILSELEKEDSDEYAFLRKSPEGRAFLEKIKKPE